MAEEMQKAESLRIKPIPDFKKEAVVKIAEKIKKANTVLIASTKGLPASQFQKIVKSLRGKADVTISKKSLVLRAISSVEKGALQNLKPHVQADVCLMFSDMDAYELAGVLIENASPAKAKAGDVAPADIHVEAGPTDLMPGPAISELGAVGLKVAVENGKLAIKEGKVILKEGEVIDEKAASIMGKLNITPMRVGFIPLAAYDSKDDKVYDHIKIDKEGALESLREGISKALGFAVGIGYVVKETISYFISKAAIEAKALEAKVSSGVSEEPKSEGASEEKSEETKEEASEENVEEVPSEEKKEDSTDDTTEKEGTN
ncbi:MAG: 50S ribosomal protein L10 [Nanoarchaeota archaeon]|nr:50S ribosomal protein L10 [Nanoarchaeota archaeon]